MYVLDKLFAKNVDMLILLFGLQRKYHLLTMAELKSKYKTATVNSLCNISFIIFKTMVGLLVSYTYYN